MKRFIAATLLLLTMTASAQTPHFVGDCYETDTRTEALQWIAYLMGLQKSQVTNTVIACDSWTPIDGLTFREIGEDVMSCHDKTYWTWHIGCMSGLSNYQPGPVLLLHMHPTVADVMIASAKAMGMSSGSRTWDEIRCFWTFDHFIRLAIHEYNHTKGYRHGDAMTAEDRRVYDYFMSIARLKGFALRYEWDACEQPQQRSYRDEAVRGRVQP